MAKKFIFVFLSVLIFFSPLLFNRFISDGDLTDEYMPKLFVIGESFKNFSFPLSEPGMGLGFPLYKDIQSGIFYPVNWIFALPFDFLFLVNVAIFVNLLIYALGLFVLVNYLYPNGKSNSSVIIALLFSGFFVSHVGHYTMLCSISVAPFFLYFFLSFLGSQRKKFFYASVFSGVLLIAAGHPQIFFLVFMVSLFSIIGKAKNLNSGLKPMMIFVFIFFASLFITAPTMNLAKYSFRADESMVYNIMPLKYLILLVFPNLFGGSSIIGESAYRGVMNVNEVQFYSSLLLLFAFSYGVQSIFAGRSRDSAKKMLIPLFFFVFSFFTEFNLHVFLTPGRSMGIAVLSFLLLFLPEAIEKHDKKTLLIFFSLFASLFILAVARKAGFASVLVPLFLFAAYMVYFLFLRQKKSSETVLALIVFIDLFLSVSGIINYSKRGDVGNEPYPELEGKRVITYLPNEVLFYEDYLKEHFKTNNLEELKRFSACGNRGVYYDALSFNLYQNFTFKKYVDFFSDRSIMTGGFSNINFIMNPLVFDYDYLLMPEMPVFFDVRASLLIPLKDGVKDSFYAYYTGEIENVIPVDAPEESYLRNIDSLKAGLLIFDGKTMLRGEGKILLLKDFKTGEFILFPRLFSEMNFEIIRKNPFWLFKRIREESDSVITVSSPIDGSPAKKQDADVAPIDFLGGLFITVIGLMSMFGYAKKEFE
ncbi:MAG: hypothetical protein PHW02_02435 [bacterium]|nr:hypothetical protein [bacterium]